MKPSILLLADYPTGVSVARYLKDRGENIIGVGRTDSTSVLNDGCNEQIRALFSDAKVFTAADLEDTQKMDILPDIVLSICWPALLGKPFLTMTRDMSQVINLHYSYLPFNRGANPNVWPIVEGTPAGVSLHYINEGADTGDIIAQQEVPVDPTDTGGSLYRKLEFAACCLFQDTWPLIVNKTATYTKQGAGTSHLRSDYRQLDEIDLDAPTTARQVINHVRAKTFAPFPGAYFVNNEKKIQIRVDLEEL